MVARQVRRSYWLPTALCLLLSACGGSDAVKREFPAALQEPVRPDAAVRLSLRPVGDPADGADGYVLRGGQGSRLAEFSRAVVGEAAETGDIRLAWSVHDGLNGGTYGFAVEAMTENLRDSDSRGMLLPRVRILDERGERIGDLELHLGYTARLEGLWRGRRVLLALHGFPSFVDEDAGFEYPDGMEIRWEGGSDAGLRVYRGREISDDGMRYELPIYDMAANRPLTRQETGDAVLLIFATDAVLAARTAADTLTVD